MFSILLVSAHAYQYPKRNAECIPATEKAPRISLFFSLQVELHYSYFWERIILIQVNNNDR